VATDTEHVFWKLLILEILLGVSETLHCSVSAFQEIIAFLLDALELVIIFATTVMCLEPKSILLMMFYDRIFLLIKILYCIQYE
jgi:hypothetical protein